MDAFSESEKLPRANPALNLVAGASNIRSMKSQKVAKYKPSRSPRLGDELLSSAMHKAQTAMRQSKELVVKSKKEVEKSSSLLKNVRYSRDARKRA